VQVGDLIIYHSGTTVTNKVGIILEHRDSGEKIRIKFFDWCVMEGWHVKWNVENNSNFEVISESG